MGEFSRKERYKMDQQQQFEVIVELLQTQTRVLEQIRDSLNQPKTAPNYQKALEDFPNFDWSSIGATIDGRDHDGVAAVVWRGNRYLRRSASNKFKPAIWFSRSTGKDDKGETVYERLITFAPLSQSEPLPDKVRPR